MPSDASQPRLPAAHWLPPSLPSLPQQLAAPGPGGSLQPCGGRESSLPLLGVCSRAQGSGELQGTATQWRSHLLKVKAPQAQSFPRAPQSSPELPQPLAGREGLPNWPPPQRLEGERTAQAGASLL